MDPVTVCNLALQEGATRTLINGFPPIENTPQAVTAGLFYQPKIQGLLRAANWDFARRQQMLTLLKSAVLNGQPSSDPPPQPWQFEYLAPNAMLKARFLIQFQQPSPNGIPFTTGPQNVISPAYANTSIPFVIGNDPLPTGQPRKVIFTNMQNAMLIYTEDLTNSPDMWDSLFLSAATATLAAYFIASLSGDKALLQQQVAMAKGILDSARAMNGNESLGSQDHLPDWLQVRSSGACWGSVSYGNGAAFYNGGGWDAMSFPDGITY